MAIEHCQVETAFWRAVVLKRTHGMLGMMPSERKEICYFWIYKKDIKILNLFWNQQYAIKVTSSSCSRCTCWAECPDYKSPSTAAQGVLCHLCAPPVVQSNVHTSFMAWRTRLRKTECIDVAMSFLKWNPGWGQHNHCKLFYSETNTLYETHCLTERVQLQYFHMSISLGQFLKVKSAMAYPWQVGVEFIKAVEML
jgi:hypothetical protein